MAASSSILSRRLRAGGLLPSAPWAVDLRYGREPVGEKSLSFQIHERFRLARQIPQFNLHSLLIHWTGRHTVNSGLVSLGLSIFTRPPRPRDGRENMSSLPVSCHFFPERISIRSRQLDANAASPVKTMNTELVIYKNLVPVPSQRLEAQFWERSAPWLRN